MASPAVIRLKIRDLRKLRRQVLTNIQEHCKQLYKQGTLSRDACKVAAAIAAAEISDVLEKTFGVKF